MKRDVECRTSQIALRFNATLIFNNTNTRTEKEKKGKNACEENPIISLNNGICLSYEVVNWKNADILFWIFL
jgi:hypothetical protein